MGLGISILYDCFITSSGVLRETGRYGLFIKKREKVVLGVARYGPQVHVSGAEPAPDTRRRQQHGVKLELCLTVREAEARRPHGNVDRYHLLADVASYPGAAVPVLHAALDVAVVEGYLVRLVQVQAEHLRLHVWEAEAHLYLRHLYRFPLETSYGAVIGYMKRLQDDWRTVRSIYADKTGVGDYIVEDVERSGLRNVVGVTFTDTSKTPPPGRPIVKIL